MNITRRDGFLNWIYEDTDSDLILLQSKKNPKRLALFERAGELYKQVNRVILKAGIKDKFKVGEVEMFFKSRKEIGYEV